MKLESVHLSSRRRTMRPDAMHRVVYYMVRAHRRVHAPSRRSNDGPSTHGALGHLRNAWDVRWAICAMRVGARAVRRGIEPRARGHVPSCADALSLAGAYY